MTKRRLQHIAPGPAAKLVGILYGVLGLAFAPVFIISAFIPTGPDGGFGVAASVALAIFMPLFYAGFGWISTWLGAAMYNALAKRLGGLEFDVE